MLLSLFAGAELISEDLKFKSFTLYLSRPLSMLDYIKGKFSIVLFYLLLFTLVPGIILIIAKIIFTGKFTISFYVIFAALVFPIIFSLFYASMILMFSSLSSNIKFVNIMFIAFIFFSNTVSGILSHELRNDNFHMLSMEKNIRQFSSVIFNVEPDFNSPAWISGVILLGMTFIFFIVLILRLKKTEV